MARPDDLGRSRSSLWDPAEPQQIPSKAFIFVVFLSLFLALGAMAILCADHRLSDLEKTLEAPTEIP